jgi:hypothetical protein
MMFRNLAALVLGVLLLSITAHAQTGPTLLARLQSEFGGDNTYKVKVGADRVILIDERTGTELFSVRDVSPQQVVISGIVGQLESMSTEHRRDVERQIAMFNFSSPVGTLTLDSRTGAILMQHNLNPRLVPVSSMINVANRFGEIAQRQSKALMQ